MSREIRETFTNGQNIERYKIVVVGGGLVRPYAFEINCFLDVPFFLRNKRLFPTDVYE